MYENILQNLSKQDLIEIHNNLNLWEWDERLGEKPEGWEDMPNFMLSEQYKLPTKKRIVSPIMREIEAKVSKKQLMKYWHINYCNMTNLQHEFWWKRMQLSKFFNIGFYSNENQKQIRSILQEIAQDNKQDWLSKTYSPQTNVNSK